MSTIGNGRNKLHFPSLLLTGLLWLSYKLNLNVCYSKFSQCLHALFVMKYKYHFEIRNYRYLTFLGA